MQLGRVMLLLDRYLVTERSAIDLATGAPVEIRRFDRPTGTALYSRHGAWRLVDAGATSPRAFVEVWGKGLSNSPVDTVPLDAVRGALFDARDGHPRAMELVADGDTAWTRAVHDLAREARLAGFVPIGAAVLGEALHAGRGQWPRCLGDRSLVVITCDGSVSPHAAAALLRLASRDARPHLVILGATSVLNRPTRLMPLACSVHESGPDDAWGGPRPPSPGALADEAWRRAEAGVADEASLATARWAVLLSPTAEHEATARAALATTLTAHGRVLEARAALAPALPLARGAGETARRLRRTEEAVADAASADRPDRLVTSDFLRVLELCQCIEDEATTLGRVLAMLRDRLGAAALAFFVSEREHLRVVAQLGPSPGAWRGVSEVLGGGPAVAPVHLNGSTDGIFPVRYGGAVTGALWARWPAGLAVLPADAAALLAVAASAVAPALHAAAERGRPPAEAPDIPDLIGDSEPMRGLRSALVRAARSPFPVLIEGESGSGKELVARAIHRASARQDRRFSALNCAALSDELAETELFGHARGAYTGAVAERAGLFEEASGGTLFLDEVSELSSAIQAKLLRVLQEHEVRRLGEAHVRRIDTRIVAATNRPLAGEVEAGRFRRDLRYRLDVVRLSIPPLRARLEDVPALVRHVWAGLCEKTGSRAVLSPAALAALGRYDWPGNVRELQNVLASLLVASPPRGVVPATHLPAHVLRSTALTACGSLAVARREFEARFVRAALARTEGRTCAAARDLGVSRQGLRKLMARLGMVGPAGP